MSGHGRTPLDGRTAFVSGAGSGIGRALARRLSAHGCPVVIADADEDGLRETERSLAGPVLARALDVRDAGAQLELAAEVERWAPSPLGMVFNVAGVTTTQPVAGAVPADDEWVMAVNFGGVVNGVRAFMPVLLAQGSGAIVNMSSVFGLVGFPGQSAYCASKFAVRGFTESLRHELRGTGVRAVTVHPGGVATNIVRNARHHAHPLRPGVSHEEAAREFEQSARTTPERAAEIIHEGVRAGRDRILVGPDARVLDALVRLAPARYFDLIAKPLSLLARRR
ncbi:MAG: SDR family NAD(P)-dependent oxidoreductase [Solirubrobacteraceae bacterium]